VTLRFMNGHAKISYDAIYEIDRASFTNEADFRKVVAALQDIEDTKVGQELFRDLHKSAHLQEGHRIRIECNFDAAEFASGTPAFAKISTGRIVINPRMLREDGMTTDGMGYPAQLDHDLDFESAPFTFSQLLVHESNHLARIPPGTNVDIASEEGLRNTACFEALAMERANRYGAEKNQPERELYVDLILEVETFKKTIDDLKQMPQNLLREVVGKIETLNAGCQQLSEDELNSRVSLTISRMFDKAQQNQR
jgi:hypothetical protein